MSNTILPSGSSQVASQEEKDDSSGWINVDGLWYPKLKPGKEFNSPDYEKINKCECGLKYSRDGGKHSDWCPEYKEEK